MWDEPIVATKEPDIFFYIKLIILDLKVFFDEDSRTVAMEVGTR